MSHIENTMPFSKLYAKIHYKSHKFNHKFAIGRGPMACLIKNMPSFPKLYAKIHYMDNLYGPPHDCFGGRSCWNCCLWVSSFRSFRGFATVGEGGSTGFTVSSARAAWSHAPQLGTTSLRGGPDLWRPPLA